MGSTGVSMQDLKDFKLSIGNRHLRAAAKGIVNLAGRRSYDWFTAWNRKKAIQGGAAVDLALMFEGAGTGAWRLPAEFRQYKRVDNAYRIQVPWRHVTADSTWTRHEMLKSEKYRYGGEDARFDVLFALDDQKRKQRHTDIVNTLEDAWGGVPNFNQMESTTVKDGVLPISFLAHVNEWYKAKYGYYTSTLTNSAVVAAGGAWTSKQGIDPAASYCASKYEPAQVTYSNATVNTMGNIFEALRAAWRQTHFDNVEMYGSSFETTGGDSGFQVRTSDMGLRALETMILAGQDKFIIGSQDPGVPNPQLYGTPIKEWPILNTIAIYDCSTGGAHAGLDAEGGSANYAIGPRFYIRNLDVLYPIVHDEMWMYEEMIDPHFNIPDVWVESSESWTNVVCEDYRQQAVVYPLNTASGFSTYTNPSK